MIWSNDTFLTGQLSMLPRRTIRGSESEPRLVLLKCDTESRTVCSPSFPLLYPSEWALGHPALTPIGIALPGGWGVIWYTGPNSTLEVERLRMA